MRSILLLVIAIALFGQSLRERRGAYNLIEHLKGEVRLGFMDYDIAQKAIGGHFHFKTKAFEGVCIGGTVEAVASDRVGELVGSERNFAMLSELFIQYKNNKSLTKAGRIMVEWTPHADADDIRMIPNYFEGLHTQIELQNATLQLLYLTKMAGWESGGKYGRFKPLNEILGVEENIDAFAGIGADGAGWSLWTYYLDRSAWVIYGSYEWVGYGWTVGVQIDRAKNVSKSYLGTIDAKTVGLYLQKEFSLATLYAAMNAEYGKGAMVSFGGGPFYTSMEILTIDMFGKNARSYALGVEKEMWHTTMGIMCGWFRGSRFQREIDVYATRKLASGVSFDMVYANVQREKNLVRAIVKYSF